MMRSLISATVLALSTACAAVDYDALISHFKKDDIKAVSRELYGHERVRTFFDVSRFQDELYLPENDLAEFFKYLFWAFDRQKYWLKIYPCKTLDPENDRPTCFMVIFEMNF